jgi:DNA polymerase-4
MERTILHVDMNNFYASVECMLDRSLLGKCVAVCGSVENRHGIVLAKQMPTEAPGAHTGLRRKFSPNG